MEGYKQLYVSPTGSDSGDGSIKAPFLTVERAYDEVCKTRDSVEVNLLKGTYKLTKTLKFDSTNTSKDRKIVFKGDGATVFGGKHVTGWEKHTDKIYKAHLDIEDARNLYINTYPATRARTKYTYVMSGVYEKDGVVVGIKVGEKNFPKNFINYKDLELVNPYEWETHRFRIIDYKYLPESREHAFEFDLTNHKITRLGKETRGFYLENDLSLLDEEGEFYFDKAEKTIYYYPYAEEDLETAECYVEEKEMFVSIYGESDENRACNITFEGIRFAGGACRVFSKYGYLSHQSDYVIETSPLRSAEPQKDGFFGINTAQFSINCADNIEFKNCEFINMGSLVIGMTHSVSNVLIEGNIIRDVSATAIRVGTPAHRYPVEGIDVCRYITIQNNVIARPSRELFSNCGISVYYENNIKVRHNVIEDTPYSGASLSWGWEGAVGYDCRDIEFAYNRVTRPMGLLSDGGGVYTLGEIKNGRIHHNLFEDSRDRAIYNDAGAAQTTSHDNVMYGCKLPFFVQRVKYKTNNINFYNNFSDRERIAVPTELECNTIKTETPIIIDRNNLTGAAKEIAENAGPTPEYRHLVEKASMPEWHKKVSCGKGWRHNFKSETDGIISKLRCEYEAEDFIEGGEGVAFHKTLKPIPFNNIYRPEEVQLHYASNYNSYVVHIIDVGEWLCYDIDVPEDDDYYIDIIGSFGINDTVLMKAYLDGELISDNIHGTKKHDVGTCATVGTFPMKRGVHRLKLEFVTPFLFDKFRVYTGKEAPVPEEYYYESDKNYDDGTFAR